MTTSDEPILLDTNVLVYAADRTSPHHEASRHLRDSGRQGLFVPCLTPQILFEFYAVVTDARRVSQPLTAADATEELTRYFTDATIRLIHPGPTIGETVQTLLRQHQIVRQDVFDALIVATMIANQVRKIGTYDAAQFRRYREVEVVNPAEWSTRPNVEDSST